jgi:hypothetical protein
MLPPPKKQKDAFQSLPSVNNNCLLVIALMLEVIIVIAILLPFLPVFISVHLYVIFLNNLDNTQHNCILLVFIVVFILASSTSYSFKLNMLEAFLLPPSHRLACATTPSSESRSYCVALASLETHFVDQINLKGMGDPPASASTQILQF